METKTTLVEVASGKIEIMNDGMNMYIQFNCECRDALPHCRGMCCAYRPLWNVDVKPTELFSQPPLRLLKMANNPGKVYLDYDRETGHCLEHDVKTGLCRIQNTTKPENCCNWHCSPGGVGEGIKFRQQGWLLSPARTRT